MDAFALAVNHTHRLYAGFKALGKIIVQQIGNISGLKCMQIQDIFDRYLNRFHV